MNERTEGVLWAVVAGQVKQIKKTKKGWAKLGFRFNPFGVAK